MLLKSSCTTGRTGSKHGSLTLGRDAIRLFQASGQKLLENKT